MAVVGSLYRRATYILVAVTFLLMLMGGYVKAINAGLSCPDWPLCYGTLFPFAGGVDISPFSKWQVFSEWFHRLWAAMVGLLLLSIVYHSKAYSKVPQLFRLGLILVILFGVQVMLGGLTVIGALNAFVVVAHLANAILIIMLEMTLAFLATLHSDVINLTSPNSLE